MQKILHIDDHRLNLMRMQRIFDSSKSKFHYAGYKTVAEFQAGLRTLPDLVILDLNLNEGLLKGIELIDIVKANSPNSKICIFSSQVKGSVIKACVRKGVKDFIATDATDYDIEKRLTHILSKAGKITESNTPTTSKNFFAGKSALSFAEKIPRILQSAVTSILIEGETGTGKEVIADILKHYCEGKPFVALNCGAISESLIESELFGHKKGAFTGAVQDKPGVIEAASGGWLFLDEINSLSERAQIALLRVLEKKEFMRVGDSRPRTSNFRLIAASNEPLGKLSETNKFRKDLWQRISEIKVELPPLRKRKEEIEPIIEILLQKLENGPYTISRETLEVLKECPWRNGNVRELRNCLRAMTVEATDKVLIPLNIPDEIWDEYDSYANTPSLVFRGEVPEEETRESMGSKEVDQDRFVSVNSGIFSTEKMQISYDDLESELFFQCIKSYFEKHGRTTVRNLANVLHLSPATISRRLKQLIAKSIVPKDELYNWVSISLKS